MAAIAEARTKEPIERRPCPVGRSRVVRLESAKQIGGELRDVLDALRDQREPKEPFAWSYELDVVDGRAFLYDYGAERVVCLGTDADDPHGTLVACDAPAR